MSKNTLYANEIATANQFILEHDNDYNLICFLKSMKDPDLIHSDRWSLIYDYISEHYPAAAAGSIVTGLAYWCED